MSNFRLRCAWVRPLAALRLTLQLRELCEEWMPVSGAAPNAALELQAFRESRLLQEMLRGAYPLVTEELLVSASCHLSQRDAEAQRGLFRCAGEALVALFRMDQSEMIGRQLRVSPSERSGILEMAQVHVREAIAPIMRQLHYSKGHGSAVVLSRAFATAAEDMLLAWVAVRLAQGEQDIKDAVAKCVETTVRSELMLLQGSDFTELFTKASGFAHSHLDELAKELSRDSVIREVLNQF